MVNDANDRHNIFTHRSKRLLSGNDSAWRLILLANRICLQQQLPGYALATRVCFRARRLVVRVLRWSDAPPDIDSTVGSGACFRIPAIESKNIFVRRASSLRASAATHDELLVPTGQTSMQKLSYPNVEQLCQTFTVHPDAELLFVRFPCATSATAFD
jgi:hypothetical protein